MATRKQPYRSHASKSRALDSLNAIMNRAELQLRFAMEAGDILLLNNHSVLHSRTAFEDHPEIDRRRHYARMWMKVPAAGTVV